MSNKIPTIQPESPDNRFNRHNHPMLFNHFVYFNLHNRKWSLKALINGPRGKGRVSGHARTILMMGVTPKVSESGRQRVIVEKRKNVHAGLIGKVVEVVNIDEFYITDNTPRIRYNPYEGPHFVDGTGYAFDPSDPCFEPIEVCVLHDGRAYWGDALYYADSDKVGDCPGFLCQADCDAWAAENDYTGWIRRDCRKSRYYVAGRFSQNVSAVCANK